ncbi:uncharacterized protein LOC122380493 isoform X2 [Amphibalanus amphitrite]|uniref:uncharacterized protein LOC122380493 isoform X2 n=1 Tax=Amphibalanus amphitrite TaxID=1232801 RepID=UPI001C912B7B|nr:uncharacterized protein LOC122380493 isoform X2 [Amphibalanus amphitrite]XP_043219638.1 uncharacterized protein LOC122380493 isoform X2 [Amphibalanus amphitrite]XP_043219645.1 uncharacterized protein LOC122380493 isoform X2 [Amphibalanus amphitrite]XP_043219654.1 uncharacterized protein LOC122380493 isoform X2 [Amphibalanus amphitrite]XP_043219664.1 uncharacterized protein LOC122380493 isoform X2 [Amphibalanus amphitrite]XP_043219673.1 uncharacterized protein LOC122380493 isoform X2 [Amphib
MLLLLPVLLLTSQTAADSDVSRMQQVLVLGGNGFIGAESVTALLRQKGRYNVTVVSRGSERYDARDRVLQHVRQLRCDRYTPCRRCPSGNPLLGCEELMAAQKEVTQWDFVIDFSGYDADAVSQALDALAEKMKYYVFISSDSVYEVCEPSTGVLSHEEAAVRPSDRRRRHDLASRDSYGDGKLSAEEVLRARAVPHVVLRLPDVLGPRDTTGRWWAYQLWVQYAGVLRRPVPIPPSVRTLRTSYVFVSDVARALTAALNRSKEVNGKAFNLALDRDFRLAELLGEIARELGVHSVVTREVNSENVARFFPSVYRGPVSWRRAREQLGFEPTPWPEVLSETVRFYRRALVRFPEERRRVFGVLESIFGDDPDVQRRLVESIERDLLDASFGKRDDGEVGESGEGLATEGGEGKDEL